jgi:hypothetical protein
LRKFKKILKKFAKNGGFYVNKLRKPYNAVSGAEPRFFDFWCANRHHFLGKMTHISTLHNLYADVIVGT